MEVVCGKQSHQYQAIIGAKPQLKTLPWATKPSRHPILGDATEGVKEQSNVAKWSTVAKTLTGIINEDLGISEECLLEKKREGATISLSAMNKEKALEQLIDPEKFICLEKLLRITALSSPRSAENAVKFHEQARFL